MTPEDRRREGAVVMLGIDENLVMANWRAVSRFGVISRNAQTSTVSKWVSRLGIKLTRHDEALANLSGGNQQKVVIGKALNTNPRLLLLDEPTRGVDVGAKAQIYALMREFANNGLAVVFVSGELEEFPGVCDRVLVLRDGRVTGEFMGDGIETQQYRLQAYAGFLQRAQMKSG
jgi:sugar transport system ATP-binding protein